MIYFLLVGGLIAAWAVLAVLSGERQRRLNELEVQQQVIEAAAAEAARRRPASRRKAA